MKDTPLAAAAPLAPSGPRFVRLDLCRVTIRRRELPTDSLRVQVIQSVPTP